MTPYAKSDSKFKERKSTLTGKITEYNIRDESMM